MAHADSRKPTTEVVVATKWSFKPKSLPNETLSSFVVRAALAHHLDPMSAANIIWGAWRAWTFDIDRRLPAEQLQQLAQSLGADKDGVKSRWTIPTLIFMPSPMNTYLKPEPVVLEFSIPCHTGNGVATRKKPNSFGSTMPWLR